MHRMTPHHSEGRPIHGSMYWSSKSCHPHSETPVSNLSHLRRMSSRRAATSSLCAALAPLGPAAPDAAGRPIYPVGFTGAISTYQKYMNQYPIYCSITLTCPKKNSHLSLTIGPPYSTRRKWQVQIPTITHPTIGIVVYVQRHLIPMGKEVRSKHPSDCPSSSSTQ